MAGSRKKESNEIERKRAAAEERERDKGPGRKKDRRDENCGLVQPHTDVM